MDGRGASSLREGCDRTQFFVCFNGGPENDDQFSLPWTEYTSRTGGQPSWRRRLGWRKGSLHGSTGRRQPECCPLHRGDVDSLELDGPLACSLIRANLKWRAGLSVCHRLVTGAVDTRRRAPRCALPWEYEAPDSRRSESSRLGQLRRCPWLSLRARAIVLLYIDLWG